MIPDNHHSIFVDYARDMQASVSCDWRDNSSPFRHLAMSSFLALHADMPDLINHQTGRKLSVAPGIVLSDQPNAFAARYRDTHVIGLTTGLENAILSIADEAFSKPYVFRHGDRRDAFLTTSLGNLLAVKGAAPAEEDLALIDDQRARAMTYVIVVMYRFALLHEFAHCLKGHVDYLAAGCPDPDFGLDELNITRRAGTNTNLLTNGEHRVLEFDADHSALVSCMRIEGLEYDRIFSGDFDPVTRFEYSMFGIYAMAWLLASLGSQEGTETHPEPVRRLSSLYTAAAATLSHEKPELVMSNHYALAQLKAVEHRVRTGWMNHGTAAHFELKDHRSVKVKMAPHAYQFADLGGEDDV